MGKSWLKLGAVLMPLIPIVFAQCEKLRLRPLWPMIGLAAGVWMAVRE